LRKVQDARLLGVEKDTEKRYSGQRSWEFDVTAQGWRYHMSNIMAAIGIEQIKRFSEMGLKRQALARRYNELLGDHTHVRIFPKNYDNVVPHIYVICIIGLQNRGLFQKTLLDLGIQTGIHYQPNHKLGSFQNNASSKLPITDIVYSELLTLPLHPEMEVDDVEFVCESLISTCHKWFCDAHQ